MDGIPDPPLEALRPRPPTRTWGDSGSLSPARLLLHPLLLPGRQEGLLLLGEDGSDAPLRVVAAGMTPPLAADSTGSSDSTTLTLISSGALHACSE